MLERACEAIDRDPATVTRSLGLYALCGEDEADLDRRFERLRAMSPPGVLDGVDLDQWREGRLVGTVDQVREQAAGWAGLGVETLVVSRARSRSRSPPSTTWNWWPAPSASSNDSGDGSLV